jgi:hypothetical protein
MDAIYYMLKLFLQQQQLYKKVESKIMMNINQKDNIPVLKKVMLKESITSALI